ncbi:MAG: stage IV sporulation protein A [Oscillospiraceae bacterium]|nr:stage IV sporulation protein A [Oscillospiraceae bacterium]
MENIYQDIAARTGGSIYIGVVGPVRTGKSTLIKRLMETMVIPHIPDPNRAKRARDELPQSGSGKTIMTSEPKFVPEEAVEIVPDGSTKLRVRLIDSVGYMVAGAVGAEENGVPRMVSTPWSDSPIPLTEAAELGTKKVMEEHASIGIVVTTDGTVTDIPRSDYVEAEQRAIRDIQKTGKPFVTIINTTDPMGEAAAAVRSELKELFGIDAAIADCQALTEEGCAALLQDLLWAFPLREVRVYLPRWVEALEEDSPIRSNIFGKLLDRCAAVRTLGGAEETLGSIRELEQVRQVRFDPMDLATGTVHCRIELPEALYYETLSRRTGTAIRSDADLLRLLTELTAVKAEYDQVAQALADVRSTGYSVVLPSRAEMTLQPAELTKKGSAFGVRLRASAPSIHMIRVDADAEISPMVGSEDQSRDLLAMLSGDPETVFESSLFGRSVYDMVREGLSTKLLRAGPEVREKFRQSLSKIINEGAQGLICIIL